MSVTELSGSPLDTISSLRFGPKGRLLSAGSWSGEVSFWDLDNSSDTLATHDFLSPVLSTSWISNGAGLAVGDGYGRVHALDITTMACEVIGQHDRPVSGIAHLDGEPNLIVSASWDGRVHLWDLRKQGPASSIEAGSSVLSICSAGTSFGIALQNRTTKVYSLTSSLEKPIYEEDLSKFSAIRVVRFLPTENGLVLGYDDGLCQVRYYDPGAKNFSFRACKDEKAHWYPIHDIVSIPGTSVFGVVGGDRLFSFWNYETKKRLSLSKLQSAPLTSCHIDVSAQLFAFAIGYDWQEGRQGLQEPLPTSVFIQELPFGTGQN